MPLSQLRPLLADFMERESLRPDLSRAIRATIAYMGTLLALSLGGVPLDPIHACIAAQTIAIIDVRGAYSLRLGLLLSITAVLCGSVALGLLGAGRWEIAILGTIVIAICGGLWRHLSTDYGPGLAVSSGLLFFVSLADPTLTGLPPGLHPVLATLVGGLFAVLLQIIFWPFHPQHPLRRTVAESWVALAELLEALSPESQASAQTITGREVDLRATLNKSQAILHASHPRSGPLLRQLELLNLCAARLGMRVIAFRTAFEAISAKPESRSWEPALATALASLGNTVRTVALAVISRQPSHWVSFEVRLKRLENLLSVARAQIQSHSPDPVAGEQLCNLIHQIERQLPILHEALRPLMERANERAAFSVELFDLGTLTLRPLASVLNLNPKIEPALTRHTIRAIILSLIGVALFKIGEIPHGYWLPFTILVVLQPDYGSTREKAFQRVLGTLVGGLLASSLLWLHPPYAVLLGAIAATIWLFAYFLKRNYGLAVVFITLMVVLLTESRHPVTLAFTLERLGCTLAGGALALLSAFLFWPMWERSNFPATMAKALRANRLYLQLTLDRLLQGGGHDDELSNAAQAAESANSTVFSSLRRMMADPKNQQEGLQQAAALANGNQRVHHALAVISLHLNEQRSHYAATLEQYGQAALAAFDALVAYEESGIPPATVPALKQALETFQLPPIQPEHMDPGRFREPWVFPQLTRIATELSAMLLTLSPAGKATLPRRAG